MQVCLQYVAMDKAICPPCFYINTVNLDGSDTLTTAWTYGQTLLVICIHFDVGKSTAQSSTQSNGILVSRVLPAFLLSQPLMCLLWLEGNCLRFELRSQI